MTVCVCFAWKLSLCAQFACHPSRLNSPALRKRGERFCQLRRPSHTPSHITRYNDVSFLCSYIVHNGGVSHAGLLTHKKPGQKRMRARAQIKTVIIETYSARCVRHLMRVRRSVLLIQTFRANRKTIDICMCTHAHDYNYEWHVMKASVLLSRRCPPQMMISRRTRAHAHRYIDA